MKIIVAITGASGVVYGARLVEELKKTKNEIFIIITKNAEKIAKYEDVKLPKATFGEDQIDAPIASGSFKVDGMIICPCSMKTMAAIANGYANNLVVRSADVMLKEKRKLILALRETPINAIHLENALKLSRLGVQIMPVSPGFYHKPKKVKDVIDFFVGRILDQLCVEHALFKRWK